MVAQTAAQDQDQFAREEQAYWAQRERLLGQYPDKWVAIVGGEVIAVGDDSREVIQEAYRKTGSTSGYVGHLGHEEDVYHIRQVQAGQYDCSPHRPMPMIAAEVRPLEAFH